MSIYKENMHVTTTQKSPKPLCLFPIPPSYPFLLPTLFTPRAVALEVWSPGKQHQSPGNSVKMQVLRPQPRPTKSEPVFYKPSR